MPALNNLERKLSSKSLRISDLLDETFNKYNVAHHVKYEFTTYDCFVINNKFFILVYNTEVHIAKKGLLYRFSIKMDLEEYQKIAEFMCML